MVRYVLIKIYYRLRKVYKCYFRVHKAYERLVRNPGYLNYKVWLLWSVYKNQAVPFRQAASFHNLNRAVDALENNDVPYWVADGTLLGAVRQKAFAGRPGDIDIFCKLENLSTLQELFSFDEGVRFCKLREDISAFSVKYETGCTVSFLLLQEDSEAGVFYRKIWVSEKHDKLHREISADSLVNDIEIDIFGKPVRAPSRPEIFLDRFYLGWRVPDKKQLSWID